jgi:2-polyprenyl-3-methyl-5-hydroxy-6-metoxy-1,4-benzoquinol methylase
MAAENPDWVEFARSMAPLIALPADLLARRIAERKIAPNRVLDVAAGHGLFGIAVARQHPAAEVIALDWGNVLEVARENAAKAGIDGRYRTLSGSAFDVELGTGYDLVLLTNFLHHFDEPTCTAFLRKVRAALRPGGWAVALEFVPNEDRVSPPIPAQFALIMLAETAGGDAYTASEYRRMFDAAGFRRVEVEPLPPSPQSLVWAQG